MPRPTFRNHWIACLIALCLAASFAGSPARAMSAAPEKSQAKENGAISEVELSRRLLDSSDRFALIVDEAVEEIKRCTPSIPIRRRAVYWQSRAVPTYAALASRSNPRLALADVLTFTAGMEKALDDSKSRELFGECGQSAIDAAKMAEENAMSVAKSVLSPQDLEELEKEIAQWKKTFHPQGAYGLDFIDRITALQDPDRPVPGSISSLAMVPFQLLSGIDAATQAVAEMNRVGQRIARTVEQSPDTGRWSMELLAYDLLETRQIAQTLESLDTLAQSMAEIAPMARELPRDMQKSMEELLDQADGRIAALSELAKDTRQTVEKTDLALDKAAAVVQETGRVFDSAQKVADSVESGSASMIQASRQWTLTVEKGQVLVERYLAASAEISRSAAQMQEVVDSARSLLDSPVVENSLQGMEKIINHAAVAGALLILFFFACLLSYKLVIKKLNA